MVKEWNKTKLKTLTKHTHKLKDKYYYIRPLHKKQHELVLF